MRRVYYLDNRSERDSQVVDVLGKNITWHLPLLILNLW